MLLDNPDVISWILDEPKVKTKMEEDLWGKSLIRDAPDKQWTNKFGESLCREIYENILGKRVWRPVKLNGYQPDWETDDEIIEVKTGTYFTKGTAHEKVLGCPFKYAEIPRLYSKPLVIVCLGGAERRCRNLYGNLPGPVQANSPEKRLFVKFFKLNRITFVGASFLLRNNHFI